MFPPIFGKQDKLSTAAKKRKGRGDEKMPELRLSRDFNFLDWGNKELGLTPVGRRSN